ncbi:MULTISPECIES: prenyltransferase [unclassified Oleiphilus]|uniref:prenyltransferase n=1 Tax=unclassified Oleiphilus TaxID=2631174 RepID=UPI0007C3838A|nr:MULTISPECIES: prenyltransferase [unclassified Oleiphilus]KZZ60552.1 hypothetical protein A3762_15590 [Oleiphilus sp. HI0125]MCH2157573.1 prenyltransferase [Oleiphilaceae bacterium]
MSVNLQNPSPSKLQSAIQTTRPPFLILAPVCVLLGLSLAYQAGYSFKLIDLILIFAAALLAHASVNSLNEYIDFKSGLDLKTERTPFSGGSGALPNNPSALKHALILGLVSLSLTALIGLYFVYSVGLILLPLGIAGIALVPCIHHGLIDYHGYA